jgi:ribosome biogenesis protein ENP2
MYLVLLCLRFVTKADLVKLGLDHLMGTPMLRAYMHGFFVDNRLYEKAKILTDPFAYETYRQQRVQKKIDEERQGRISLVKKLPKVMIIVLRKSQYLTFPYFICQPP